MYVVLIVTMGTVKTSVCELEQQIQKLLEAQRPSAKERTTASGRVRGTIDYRKSAQENERSFFGSSA